MRAAPGLEADQAARQVGERCQHLGAPQPLAQDHPAVMIDAVRGIQLTIANTALSTRVGRADPRGLLLAEEVASALPLSSAISPTNHDLDTSVRTRAFCGARVRDWVSFTTPDHSEALPRKTVPFNEIISNCRSAALRQASVVLLLTLCVGVPNNLYTTI
jgi:hypothetical protein